MRFSLATLGVGLAMAGCPAGMSPYGDGSACQGGGRSCGMWGNSNLSPCTCQSGGTPYGDGSACQGGIQSTCALYGNAGIPRCCPSSMTPFGDGSACQGGNRPNCARYGNTALPRCSCPTNWSPIGDFSACQQGQASCALWGNAGLPLCTDTPTPASPPVSPPASGCSAWQTGTLTGYDNLDATDDPNPGSLNEYSSPNLQAARNFLSNVPVVSIHNRDWASYKYHNINIKLSNGIMGTVQSWDECQNADCPDNTKTCCDTNAAQFNQAHPFLLDVERQTLARLFQTTSWDSTEVAVQYQICSSFDPSPIAQRYGYTN